MSSTERLFLGVERSASGRRWVHALDLRAEGAAKRMVDDARLPDLVARVLAARGVAPEAAARFLDPTVRDLMPDPSTLTDMDRAAERVADAIARRERVAVFGDYDVDGAASSALIARYLRAFGMEARVRIPDRVSEGYGPNPAAIRELAAEGATLIVAVDCGTGSFEALEAAREAGVDVVVLDHHQTGAALPPAAAIVNPNRQDDLSGQGHLCAAGVVFLALAAVSRELRRRGYTALPDLRADLDLVALATVCDVVPLVGFNRALVVKGLAVMRALENPGLRMLAEVARVNGPMDTFHLGFLLGPRINAGGRIGAAHLGVRLLAATEEAEAREIADELHLLNAERQLMERDMLSEAEAEARAEIGAGEGPPVIVVGRETWHPGIVGLIAARLKERFNRPAFAISFDGTGRGTGSGRSIPGFDIGAFVRRGVETGLLLKGGGHAMAAGLTIRRERLQGLREAAEAARETVDRLRAVDLLKVDGALSAMAMRPETVAEIERAGPFGAGHAAPVFALARHRLTGAVPVGTGGHIRATLRAPDGSVATAMAFRAEGTPVGDTLLARRDDLLHVAGTLGVDRYKGRESAVMRIVDVAVPAV